ncbi:vesicle-associated membrane protein 5 [Electrophorus electricus]|uniref:V-SNARE coiled-coil homology domain-containing protein n=1 Tax=Electrophorus electricus TaxID=8005 RepID=A0AAY5EW75_ELEEL|nr:vesicle-associated membrane protein 5 [Electrophorus electricus]
MENGHGRLQQMQENVEEVRVIMLDNLNRAEQRDSGLSELEDRSTQLQEKSKVFAKTSGQVKQKTKKDYIKCKVIMGVSIAILIIIIVIVVLSVLKYGNSEKDNSGPKAAGEAETPKR